MKNIEHENFVGIYDNFFSEELCQNLIDHFEWCLTNNRTYGRGSTDEYLKSDRSTNLNPCAIEELRLSLPHVEQYVQAFNSVFWDECYADYIKNYSILGQYEKHSIMTYKLQKTRPTEGYHIWHCEDSSINFSKRIGTYILYLNDVEDGGETEFLYLSKRISPKAGRLLIFPANYPWAHRGNPPLSGVKYIMTGWTEFV